MLLAPLATANGSKNGGGDVIVVAGWEKLNNGRLGPVQKSGAVRLGDRLIQVNQIQILTLVFKDVMGLLRSLRENGSLKSLTFISDKHLHSKNKINDVAGGVVSGIMNEERSVQSRSFGPTTLGGKYTFYSSIIDFRYNEGGTKVEEKNNVSKPTLDNTSSTSDSANEKKMDESKEQSNDHGARAEYQIECNLITRGYGGELAESTQTWTLWKRFSQILELHEKLVLVYGWRLTNVTNFPSKKLFASSLLFLNSHLRDNFMESRRQELDQYWQSMITIKEITDFSLPHRYSRDLASFLSIEQYLNSPNPSSKTGVLENTMSDDSSSDVEERNRIQINNSASNSGSNLQALNRMKNNSVGNLSLSKISKISAMQRRPSSLLTKQYKNLIPAKSFYQRRNPSIEVSTMLAFGLSR